MEKQIDERECASVVAPRFLLFFPEISIGLIASIVDWRLTSCFATWKRVRRRLGFPRIPVFDNYGYGACSEKNPADLAHDSTDLNGFKQRNSCKHRGLIRKKDYKILWKRKFDGKTSVETSHGWWNVKQRIALDIMLFNRRLVILVVAWNGREWNVFRDAMPVTHHALLSLLQTI